MQRIDWQKFAEVKASGIPIMDVRSEGEYERAHIPGAVSMPMFDNSERAEVGTLYKQVGPEAAIERGLQIVGDKLASFYTKAKSLAVDGRIGVYCWRGGMRSGSVAQFLSMLGLDVVVLSGGYKGYRQSVLSFLENPPQHTFNIIAGKTGSGKTEILLAMSNKGEYILDLEGLANHKGSALGGLGQPPQPTQEMFENLIVHHLHILGTKSPIWAESESKSIGRLYIPPTIYAQLEKGRAFMMTIPDLERKKRLELEYGSFDPSQFVDVLTKIGKRMGYDKYKVLQDALAENDRPLVLSLLMDYYDKTYLHSLDAKFPDAVSLDFGIFDAGVIAASILKSAAG